MPDVRSNNVTHREQRLNHPVKLKFIILDFIKKGITKQ